MLVEHLARPLWWYPVSTAQKPAQDLRQLLRHKVVDKPQQEKEHGVLAIVRNKQGGQN